MTTVGQALARGRASLQGDSEHPARDAVLLLAHALNEHAAYPYLHPEARLSLAQMVDYLRLIERRKAGEPVAYLQGYREFMGMRFQVDQRVLIPRPETEILVGAALETLRVLTPAGGLKQAEQLRMPEPADALNERPVVADIGCGSGAVGLSLARLHPAVQVLLSDASLDALDVAAANAVSLGVLDRTCFFHGDLATPLFRAGFAGKIDVAVSNPPYIPSEEMDELPAEVGRFEPRLALDGGPGGLAVITRLADEVPELLRPGGKLLTEIGDGQADACRGIFAEIGAWKDFEVLLDYSGKQRVVIVTI